MTDIAIEVEVLDENHVHAVLWLSQDLTAGAGAELRPLSEQSASRTDAGLSASELVLTGLLSATTVRAVASVLVAWVQARAKRKLTLKSGEDQLVIDGTVTQAQQDVVEKWMSGRSSSG